MSWATEIDDIDKLIGFVTAIAGFCLGIYKCLIKPLKKRVERKKQLEAKIDKIYYEIRPNSGNSIKDSIKRLEKGVNDLNLKMVALQEVSDAFREDGPLGIFECTQDGKNLYVNRTYAKWLGVSKSDLLGYNWKNYLESFALKSEYDNEWKEAFQEGREVTFPIAFKNKTNKEDFVCKVHAYPIRNESTGDVIKYLGLIYKEHSLNKDIFDNPTPL